MSESDDLFTWDVQGDETLYVDQGCEWCGADPGEFCTEECQSMHADEDGADL